MSPSWIEWDLNCAEILESVEDYFEQREPDYDPDTRWIGGDWRIGRSGLHTKRIREKAADALPGWVVARAERHYARVDRLS